MSLAQDLSSLSADRVTAVATTAPPPYSPAHRRNARIALIAFDSLGDGLIYLMIADNLKRNGYDVTYYGNVAFQMGDWLPGLQIKPYPAPHAFEEEFDCYDLTIASPPRFIRQKMDSRYTEHLREKWLLVCEKAPASWHADHSVRIRRSKDAKTFAALEGLLDCSGSIRYRQFGEESVVEMTLQYMKEKMHLDEVSKTPPIVPPPGLQHRRFSKRVVVCPDSASPEQKDWTPSSFIKLCGKLQECGYAPQIVVAPKNHATWANMPGNRFETPCFHDIKDLCSHIYESGLVIANDSGNGHLASFLDVPVITIYRRNNPKFRWRPDWGRGIVVCPEFTIPWPKRPLWRPFVRMARILSAVERLR